MRLFLFAILTCTMFANQLQAQNKKIKSIRTFEYESLDSTGKTKGAMRKGPERNRLERFDESGKIIEIQYLSTDTSYLYKSEYSYDQKDNLISIIARYSAGSIRDELTYSYDDQNKKVSEKYSNNLGDKSETRFIYGSNGALLTEEKSSRWGGTRIEYQTTKEGKLLSTVKYRVSTSGSEEITDKEFYNETGQKTKHEYYSLGKLLTSTTYKYDSHGQMIESIAYDQDNKVKSKYTYDFTYDASGNWIRKVSFTNGKANAIYERTIVYY